MTEHIPKHARLAELAHRSMLTTCRSGRGFARVQARVTAFGQLDHSSALTPKSFDVTHVVQRTTGPQPVRAKSLINVPWLHKRETAPSNEPPANEKLMYSPHAVNPSGEKANISDEILEVW